MTNPGLPGAGAILLLAVAGTACDRAPQRVLTVEEVVPRIDELDGQTVSVAGYLSECGGYDCILHRTKADADAWDGALAALRANRRAQMPDVPFLGIGSGTNFAFDATAAPFTHGYVVITGTITNVCRFQGKPDCLDRGPDIHPIAIRGGNPPAR